MRPQKLQVFPNWSPILDLEVMQPNDSLHQSRNRPSIFVTSGRQPYSFVTEIRYGHEASVKLELAFDEDLTGATGIWAVADPSLQGRLFFISFPDQTIVVPVMNDYQEDMTGLEDTGADLTGQTIAVMQGDDRVIQITRHNILVLEFEDSDSTLHRSATLDIAEGNVLAAAIDSAASLVILAIQSTSGPILQQYVINTSAEDVMVTTVGKPFSLDRYPTAITIFNHGLETHIAVGTQESVIQLLTYSQESGYRSAELYDGAEPSPDSQANVIEDIAILTDCSDTELVLLCGLRGGNLWSFDLKVPNAEEFATFVFGARSVLTLGSSPVRLFTDPSSISPTGFAVCGPDICRLDYGNGREFGISLSSVWFNDGLKPNFAQPFLPVMDILSSLTDKRSTISDIVLYSDSKLIIASVDGMKKAIPRKIPLSNAAVEEDTLRIIGLPEVPQPPKDSPGTPHALLYSKSLNAMVIALTKYSVKPGGRRDNPWSGTRIWNGVIQFLPISTNSSDGTHYNNEEELNRSMGTVINLDLGERVLSICEWRYNDGQSVHELILVGTAAIDDVSKYGRLYFLKTRLDANNQVHAKVMLIKHVKNPIRALAVYDERRIVVCHGSDLCVYGLESQRGLQNTWTRHVYTILRNFQDILINF